MQESDLNLGRIGRVAVSSGRTRLPREAFIGQQIRFAENGGLNGDGEQAVPHKDGTNVYLRELGLSHDKIEDYFSAYDSNVVKATARVAYELAQRTSPQEAILRIPYLVEMVNLLGESATRRLLFRLKEDPAKVFENFRFHDFYGVKLVVPAGHASVLERIAKNSAPPQEVTKFVGLKPVYANERTVIYRA